MRSLVDRLATERRRLDELSVDDLDVRTTFLTSYEALSREHKRLFRYLGIFPGSSFTVWPLAALLDSPLIEAARSLEALVNAQLVDVAGTDETDSARYRLHDLVKALAREQVETKDKARIGAVEQRLLGAYIAAAANAEDLFQPGEVRKVSSFPRHELESAPMLDFIGNPPAWFRAERSCLVGCVELAYRKGYWDAAWELSHRLAPFFELTATWDDWDAVLAWATKSAERSSDRSARAVVKMDTAALHRDRGELEEEYQAYSDALSAFTLIGDRHGIAWAHLGQAQMHRNRGEWEQADDALEKSYSKFEGTGEKRLVAQVLRNFAIVRDAQGRFTESIEFFERALQGHRELGDRRAEAYALRGMGYAYLHNRELPKSQESFEMSKTMTEALGDRRGEARALQGLGRMYKTCTSFGPAMTCYSKAMAIAVEFHDTTLISELQADIAFIDRSN